MFFFGNVFKPWDFYLKTSRPVMSTTKCCYRLHVVMPVREYPIRMGSFVCRVDSCAMYLHEKKLNWVKFPPNCSALVGRVRDYTIHYPLFLIWYTPSELVKEVENDQTSTTDKRQQAKHHIAIDYLDSYMDSIYPDGKRF